MTTWWERLLGRSSSSPGAGKTALETPKALAGGRLTTEDVGWPWLTSVLLAPESPEASWRQLDLDAKTLDRMSPAELMRLLPDVSPDVSRALWDFLRMCNPGWQAHAVRPDGEDPDPVAQAALVAFLAGISGPYAASNAVGADAVFGLLFAGAFLRGAFFAELVLDSTGRTPLNLAVIDPISARFSLTDDAQLGQIWQLGQMQRGAFTPLTRATIQYTPIDPLPGRPYGRPLASSALTTVLFSIGLMNDLRRVVQQQGWPRVDVSIDFEKLAALMPASLENDPSAVQAWADSAIAAVQQIYSELEPDDAYIHSSVITVNSGVGAVSGNSLGAIDGVIRALERLAVRALKTMPIMMGINEATTETHAVQQWEIHAAGIKALQHRLEAMLERLLGLALQAQGYQVTVRFRFAELRASEMMRDAQTEALLIANAAAKRDQGWISQDEAALAVVGHAAVGSAPAAPPSGQGGLLMGTTVKSGRRAQRQAGAGARVNIIPEGADEPLLPVPDEVIISDGDVDRALRLWDDLMPEWAGLLAATVEGQADFDGAQAAGLTGIRRPLAPGESPWTWDAHAHRYRNNATGRYMANTQMVDLRDQFAAANREWMAGLAQRLSNGEVTLQQWELDFRQRLRSVFLDQYCLGRGGRLAMTQSDWGQVGHMLRDQYHYLHDFAAQVANGDLSAARIASRSQLYLQASTLAYERGRSAGFGMPRLPAYPGDGTTECMVGCRCTWEIQETESAWMCTWTLHPAEHCSTCLERSATWAPLEIARPAA